MTILAEIVRFVDPNRALELFGVKLVGINAASGKKLLFTIVLIVVLMLLSKVLRLLARGVTRQGERVAFWVRQGIHVFTGIVLVLGIARIATTAPPPSASCWRPRNGTR